MLDTVKEGLLNLALAYFGLLKYYTRKYPPSFKSQNLEKFHFLFAAYCAIFF